MVVTRQDNPMQLNENNPSPLRALFYPIYKRTTTEERTAPLLQYLTAQRRGVALPEMNGFVKNNELHDHRSARNKRSLYGLGYGYGAPSYSNYPYSYGNAFLNTGFGGYGFGYGGYGGGYLDPYCDLLG